ncbi:MAG: peptidoglycan DD-metalloendopeptidase family protein [Candidatus Aminicenantes bacterium]|nr:peptidoglycan DD-metalloendopeptidase family protein [Candidatus Aminicenantes bacterium]
MKLCKKKLEKPYRFLGISIILILAVSLDGNRQQDVSEYQERLAKISQQIEQLRMKIEEEEKKESTTLSRLGRIGFNKGLIKKEISLYAIQLEKANRELSSLNKSIPELEAKLEEETQSIEKILITTYKFGKFNFLQFMLQAENVGTLISENKNLTLLAQYQEKIISSYMDNLNKLERAEKELQAKKKEASRLIKNAEQKRKELQVQERKNRALITEIKKNKKLHLQTIDELKVRAQQLLLLIEKLLKEEISFPINLIPLYEKKGKLSWPIEGKVTTEFGEQRHPQFKTTTMNNGIEISPKKNYVIVRSIHPGKVVYADYFQGYGNLIIIDHGMSYYTLYGHCSDILVKKGDMVKAEHPIALVGDIGSFEGDSVYFEIRFKTKPLNPLQWLK